MNLTVCGKRTVDDHGLRGLVVQPLHSSQEGRTGYFVLVQEARRHRVLFDQPYHLVGAGLGGRCIRRQTFDRAREGALHDALELLEASREHLVLLQGLGELLLQLVHIGAFEADALHVLKHSTHRRQLDQRVLAKPRHQRRRFVFELRHLIAQLGERIGWLDHRRRSGK